MKIVVINLARSRDRREMVQSNLARLGLDFEFFTAIDAWLGQHVGLSRYDESAAWRDLHRPMSSGEIGCFASHYLLWQECLRARAPLVIMEDDVVIDDGFVRALKVVPDLISVFPVLRLGVTREGPNSSPISFVSDGLEVVSLGAGTYGTQCYVLSEVGANALLEHADVWSLPVDIYMDRSQVCGVDNKGLRPYYVIHADPHAYPSVIGDERYEQWRESPDEKIRSLIEQFLIARGDGRTLLRD